MFEPELEALLAEVSNDTNRIEMRELRDWTVDYLQEYSNEVERFPKTRGVPHWNLFAKDGAGDAAVFVLLVFDSDVLSVAAGQSRASEVRDFGENYDGDASPVIAAIKSRSDSSTSVVSTTRKLAYKWIGSD